MTETAADIAAECRSSGKAETFVARSYARIRAHADPAIFISLRNEADAMAEARALSARGPAGLSLFGVPVAVKDNIDVAGLPTSAACPAYSYAPEKDAAAVARLRAAGAIVIGKTNLDQFATGLVGVRSPYGVPRNPHRPDLIPGGSSSGSAVAVAAGLVPLSLGTDTAGSGRVPAGLNNIVGLKPSLGLVPASGVVPACRSLDCVSVFALTVDDAHLALAAMAGRDASDFFSRAFAPVVAGPLPGRFRVAVPRPQDLKFFGDEAAKAAFEAALARLEPLGGAAEAIDFSPFFEAALLLYEGAWVAERWAAVGDFIAAHPSDIHPVTREIIARGRDVSAAEAFRSFYKLAELKQKAMPVISAFDALLVPTAPASYTVAQVEADPVRLNSNLGTYTNFVNLFDLAGLAVPSTIAADGTPYGVTLLAQSGRDGFLASIGRALHEAASLPMGALGKAMPHVAPADARPLDGEIALAVVGAHLSGMPLNGELRALGARFLEAVRTAPHYRLYALANTRPPKPGMLRVADGAGAEIEMEIWALPAEQFGPFVARIPAPLGIGTAELSDGRSVKSFLVEAEAVRGASDISRFGGWRNYMAQAKAPA